jgi:hypothetical protein
MTDFYALLPPSLVLRKPATEELFHGLILKEDCNWVILDDFEPI